MKEFLQKITELIKQKRSFILYILIGFTGLTLDLISFVVMVRIFHINEFIANPISMSVGIINNFFINAFVNFKKTDRLLMRFLSFYLVGIVGIFVGNTFLWFFNGVIGGYVGAVLTWISPVVAKYQLELVKAVSIVFIAIMQYFLNKRFSFKQ